MATQNFSSLPNNFTNHLLVAMPGMLDPNFSNAVIYICEHSDKGAMGLVINQPLDLRLQEIFEQFELEHLPDTGNQELLAGGPVQLERGFVLHPFEGRIWEGTTSLTSDLSLTSSRDIIVDIALAKGPRKSLITLGYSGWGAGQLEEEIASNSWLTVPADDAILFDTPYEKRASVAAQRIGLDFSRLSSTIGHA